MKWAWIESGAVRAICPGNPKDLYHPAVADLYTTQIPDDVEVNAKWVNGGWSNPLPPTPPEPPTPPAPQVSPVEFKLLFTSAERLAIRAARTAGDLVLEDWFGILDDPRLTVVDLGLKSTQDGVGYLVLQGILTTERAAAIISNTPPS